MRINIHAGHGKQDSKSCGADGIIKESIENRKVKDEVIALLKQEGHTVYDCTVDYPVNANDCVAKQVMNCNKHIVDIDVSIHFNSGRKDPNGDGSTGGVEVLVYNSTGVKQEYAKRVCESVAKLGYTNRGVKIRTNLGYLSKVKNQCILIECCFVDDADDVKKYNYKTMAKAIVEGILNKKLEEDTMYRVICGSYKNKLNAEEQVRKLEKNGYSAFIELYKK